MKRTKIFSLLLGLILIVGVTASFAQDAKASNRKLRADIERLTRDAKQAASGAYLARFQLNAEKTGLEFRTKKSLWAKLSEAEKIRIAEDWWRRWRVIRGAANDDNNIGYMSSSADAAEEIICISGRCYIPAECAL